MLQKILVPLDGSSFAEGAIETARLIASKHGATLLFVSVHEPAMEEPTKVVSGAPVPDPRLDRERHRALQEYVQRMAAAERQRSTFPVEAVLADGDPATEIAGLADRSGVGLIVMTTHGRGGLERLWLGSTADRLVRSVHVPVLLVKSQEQGTGPARLDRVVVALARRSEDERVLAAVMDVTEPLRAVYHLIHVVVTRLPVPAVDLGVPPVPDELAALAAAGESEERQLARQYLEGIAATLHERGLEATSEVLRDGSVARAITDYAARTGANLIALATRGLGPVQRFLVGSVADKVMRSAHTNVLICPPGS
ncbi:MAG TPA: universal stress protein [Gemmatimonadaceae bacterium]|nr:universal stress protein [Gemmatimonadaceae bacterium]